MELGLEIKNLTKHYDSFSLNQVSIKLPKGSIMGLIGENGAGKTTLIKAILGATGYEQGEILINGKSLSIDDTATKETIGFVPDANFFHDFLSPREVGKVMQGIYKHWDFAQYKAYLERFSIAENKKIKTLSLGMKKKLLIATALCHNAKLLILDEMMNGLDPVARSDIRDLLMEFIQEEDCSIFISSHITEDLEKICDYITLIQNGTVFLSQNKDNLMQQYGILKCGKNEFAGIDKADYLSFRENGFGYEALVSNRNLIEKKYQNILIDKASLEDIMIFLARGEKQ